MSHLLPCRCRAVAASQADGGLAAFSSWGVEPAVRGVHLAAPGVAIPSPSHTSNTGLDFPSGTSMACPLVSGAAALLWAAQPGATYRQVRCGGAALEEPLSSETTPAWASLLPAVRSFSALLKPCADPPF